MEHLLQPGVLLDGRYRVDYVLGEGGFGITYAAENTRIGLKVAIKELFWRDHSVRNMAVSPEIVLSRTQDVTVFQKQKDRFLREARTLRSFSGLPGIVHVLDYFEANGTAYIVMERVDGETLGSIISRGNIMDAESLFRHALPLIESLGRIHQEGVIHRDISPDNIMVQPDGSWTLIDFGAARQFAQEQAKPYTTIAKVSYSPGEQYDKNGRQGPWTDVYSLCATLYHCIVGSPPESAIQRMFLDELKSPSEMGIILAPEHEKILMKGLQMDSTRRYSSMEELAQAIYATLPQRASNNERKPFFIGLTVGLVCMVAVIILLLLRQSQCAGISSDMEKTAHETLNETASSLPFNLQEYETLEEEKSFPEALNASVTNTSEPSPAPTSVLSPITLASRKTIAAGTDHTVGLKLDGTVVAVGRNDYGQCNVSGWTDIVAIAAGGMHTVGLRSDGTVVAVGDNENGQCNVSEWKNIMAVSAGDCHTVGLRADGTVVATAYTGDSFWNYGQWDVANWTDIVAIAAGYYHTMGLKADGTVVAVGRNDYGQCNVSEWTDIIAIAAGDWHTVGLKVDGTVMVIGANWVHDDVDRWTGIVDIAAGDWHTAGRKADGTVVAIGNNDYSQCNVSEWKDIVAIAAGPYHTMGLKADGTVVAVGNNEYSQCNVSEWKDILVIATDYAHTVDLNTDGTVMAADENEKGQYDVFDRKGMEWTLEKATEVFEKNIIVPENVAQYKKVLTAQLTEEQAEAFQEGVAFICVPNVLAADEKAIQGIAYLPVELSDDNKLNAYFSGLYVAVDEKQSEYLQAQYVTTNPILMSYQNSLDDSKASLSLIGVFYGELDVMYDPFTINVDYGSNTAQIETILLEESTKKPRINGYYSSYRYTHILNEDNELPHFLDMKSTAWTLWYEKKIDAPKAIVLRPVRGSGCMVLFSITNKDGTRYSLAPVNYD